MKLINNPKMIRIICLIISVILITKTFEKCGQHALIDEKKEIEKVKLWESKTRFLQETTWTPIRIYLDYKTLDSQKSFLSQSTIDNIKKVMETVSSTLSKIINVKSSSSNLKVPPCNPEKIQVSDQVKAGVAADIVIFPYVDTTWAENTEAAATFCAVDSMTGRPVSGYVGFNKNINFSKKNSLYYQEMLVLHEISHVLYFHSDLFLTFKDSDLKTIPVEKTITKINVNGVERKAIISPKVLETAKQHFGCNSIQGVELENQGGEGTAGSHWEMRVMNGDYMIGESYTENVISPMSLALMEDSGWYKVNYYTGGLFRYGKGRGCDFLNTKCVNNGGTKFPNEFSVSQSVEMCTAGRTSKGISSLNPRKDVPVQYQYFSDKTLGGHENADFCPIATETGVDGYFFGSTCIYGYTSLPPSMGEVIGNDSNCFMSSLTPQNDNSVLSYKGSNRAICYPIACDYKNLSYSVKVGSKSVICPSQGGNVTVDGFDGSLDCPDFNILCTKTVPCGDTLDCVAKKSQELGAAVLPSNNPTPTPTPTTSPSTPSTPDTNTGGQGSTTTPSTNTNVSPSSSSTSSSLNLATSFISILLFMIF